jgi:hypothetical protein
MEFCYSLNWMLFIADEIKMFFAFLIPPVHDTVHAHPIFFVFITLHYIHGEEYILASENPYYALLSVLTSSLLSSDILPSRRWVALIMEAAGTSEVLVNFYTTQQPRRRPSSYSPP